MSQSLEEMCPSYISERLLVLSLASVDAVQAFRRLVITVDYSQADPNGVMLPLEMIVQGASRESYQRRVFSRVAPSTLIFTPKEGGRHLVTLREFAHNKWWGSLVLSVEGPLLEPPRPV